MDAFYEAAKQLSPPVAAALAALEPGVASGVTEIRLRCQQPVTLQTMQGTLYLTKSGHVRMLSLIHISGFLRMLEEGGVQPEK